MEMNVDVHEKTKSVNCVVSKQNRAAKIAALL
jgi:hypothetical protein